MGTTCEQARVGKEDQRCSGFCVIRCAPTHAIAHMKAVLKDVGALAVDLDVQARTKSCECEPRKRALHVTQLVQARTS